MDRLAAMETFVRVVETGSFSAAARDLSVGQPAVSKTVAQLEEHLGVRLLRRSTRGLSPTEAGQTFYDRARRAIAEANEAEHAARGAGAGLTGRLRVSAAVTFARIHIIPRLPEFLAAHPDLVMDIILDDRVIGLVEEGIDIALRMGSLGDSSLTARKLASAPRRVVGTASYFARAGVPATPAELATHAAVIYTQDGGSGSWRFRQGATETSVDMKGPIRVSAAEGVRAGVLAGMGLAVASEWMFSPELASGEVRAVLSEWSLLPTDLWAVYPTGRMPSAKARAFAAFVVAALRQDHSTPE
ncbi:MAG TPA: LysR family transcriptional regulator [Acetobacteraceae bacterium]|nr:LysR family transcriptional regulator [Acetobacteraceae bacterium]